MIYRPNIFKENLGKVEDRFTKGVKTQRGLDGPRNMKAQYQNEGMENGVLERKADFGRSRTRTGRTSIVHFGILSGSSVFGVLKFTLQEARLD